MRQRNNLLIVWHGGLGDHIISNAIVREKAKQYELVCLPVKYRNCASVEYMFRDLENVVIRPVEDDADMLFFRDNVWKYPVLNLGGFGNGFNGSEWDVSFFQQAGMEFSDRWNKWECKRDESAEETIFEKVHKLVPGPYSWAFWHEDTKRGLVIRESYNADLQKKCTIMIPPTASVTPVMFHWRKVIEACDEIHCIASSFAAFIDSISLPKNPKLFLHKYCRPGEALMKVNKNWEILT